MRLSAFTLIELLVVVTVIVVLLALLAPAMDQAIYQAELTVCGANQHSIAAAVITYASGNRRAYPDRPQKRGAGQVNLIELIASGGLEERPMLQKAFPLTALMDPLTPKIDLSREANATASFQVHAPLGLWFGVQYPVKQPGGRGLLRLGDRLEFGGERFSVLASDVDSALPGNAFTSHPDRDGAMWNQVMQNEPANAQGYRFTLSRWVLNGGYKRAPIDSNYAFDDGSTRRYDGVTWDEAHTGGRMIEVPWADSTSYPVPGYHNHLPPR